MKTAEWQCTKCDATNRKFIADNLSRTEDRCVTCRTKHIVEEDARPVRWRAVAQAK
jgi:hypothetical protein